MKTVKLVGLFFLGFAYFNCKGTKRQSSPEALCPMAIELIKRKIPQSTVSSTPILSAQFDCTPRIIRYLGVASVSYRLLGQLSESKELPFDGRSSEWEPIEINSQSDKQKIYDLVSNWLKEPDLPSDENWSGQIIQKQALYLESIK